VYASPHFNNICYRNISITNSPPLQGMDCPYYIPETIWTTRHSFISHTEHLYSQFPPILTSYLFGIGASRQKLMETGERLVIEDSTLNIY